MKCMRLACTTSEGGRDRTPTPDKNHSTLSPPVVEDKGAENEKWKWIGKPPSPQGGRGFIHWPLLALCTLRHFGQADSTWVVHFRAPQDGAGSVEGT